MKKLLLISAVIVALTAANAIAQMGGGMMGDQQGQQGQGGMMGPGMMGPGMRYDTGPGYKQDKEKHQRFLDDTTKMRKELYDKRFEYFEKVRNPDTKQETISKLEKEIQELQKKLYEKAPK